MYEYFLLFINFTQFCEILQNCQYDIFLLNLEYSIRYMFNVQLEYNSNLKLGA